MYFDQRWIGFNGITESVIPKVVQGVSDQFWDMIYADNFAIWLAFHVRGDEMMKYGTSVTRPRAHVEYFPTRFEE